MSYLGNPIVSTDFPKDTFSGNGSTTAFTMQIAPASVNSVIVVVSGITQDPSTYTISGTTLTFSGAPPTGTSNISVRHLGVAGIPNTPSDASVTQAKLGNNVVGNGPAFGASRTGSNQSISNNTATKVQLNTEDYDTASCFDSSTNYRFTPTVAGYYQINGGIGLNATTMGITIVFLYKNGSPHKRGTDIRTNQSGDAVGVVSSLVYLNGSTDYIEMYGYINATVGSPIFVGDATLTYLNGTLVRAA